MRENLDCKFVSNACQTLFAVDLSEMPFLLLMTLNFRKEPTHTIGFESKLNMFIHYLLLRILAYPRSAPSHKYGKENRFLR